MLVSEPFYHSTVENLISAFGAIFNNIMIKIPDASGGADRIIKVPLVYSPKNIWHERLRQEGSIKDGKKVAQVFPRMGFAISSIVYDTERKLNSVHQHLAVEPGSNRKLRAVYQRVPYNVNIDLSIAAKKQEHAWRIAEQILPYFTPELTITIKDNTDLGMVTDVPIVIKGVDYQFDYMGDVNDKESTYVTMTLPFVCPIYFYHHTPSSGIIRKVIVNLYNDTSSNARRIMRVQTTPDPASAGPEDAFEYSTTVTEYQDGLIYNPNTGLDDTELSSSSSSSSSSSDPTSSSSSS